MAKKASPPNIKVKETVDTTPNASSPTKEDTRKPAASEDTSNMNDDSNKSPSKKKQSKKRKAEDTEHETTNTSNKEQEETKPNDTNDDDDDNNNNNNEEEEEENEDRKVAAKLDIDLTKPIKKARTPYFIFSDEKRAEIQAKHKGEGVAVVARELGQLWSKMSAEEKAVYQEKAALEREQVAEKIAKLEAAGIDLSTLPGAIKSNDAANTNTLIFPAGRIRKICKLDPEVKKLSPEAIALVAKCTELMTAKLGGEAGRVAQIQNRRAILPEDVANVTQTRGQFLFLKDDVKDLVREHLEQQKQKKDGPPQLSEKAKAAAANSKPLTAYFSSNKSS